MTKKRRALLLLFIAIAVLTLAAGILAKLYTDEAEGLKTMISGLSQDALDNSAAKQEYVFSAKCARLYTAAAAGCGALCAVTLFFFLLPGLVQKRREEYYGEFHKKG